MSPLQRAEEGSFLRLDTLDVLEPVEVAVEASNAVVARLCLSRPERGTGATRWYPASAIMAVAWRCGCSGRLPFAEGARFIAVARWRRVRFQAAGKFADGANPPPDQLVTLDFPADSLPHLEGKPPANTFRYDDLPLGGDCRCSVCHTTPEYQKSFSLRKRLVVSEAHARVELLCGRHFREGLHFAEPLAGDV